MFFYRQHFYQQSQVRLANNQANAKHHPEAKLCYLKIIRILNQRDHPKIIGHIPKNKQKNKCVFIHEIYD